MPFDVSHNMTRPCDMSRYNLQNFWYFFLATKQLSSQSYVTRYDHISKKVEDLSRSQ